MTMLSTMNKQDVWVQFYAPEDEHMIQLKLLFVEGLKEYKELSWQVRRQFWNVCIVLHEMDAEMIEALINILWSLRGEDNRHLLEPCWGADIFLAKLKEELDRKGFKKES